MTLTNVTLKRFGCHLTAVLWLTACATPGLPAAPRPNVLVITADDLGFQRGGYADTLATTPNMDRMAREGVRFTRGYVTQASCSSSRSTLLTGLYPHQNGQIGLAGRDNDPAGATNGYSMRPNVPTRPSLLKQAGYRTGIIGKLHVRPEGAFDFDSKELATGDTRDMAKLRAKCNAFLGEASGKPIFLYLNLYAPHAPWPRDVQGSPRVKVTAEQVGFFPFMGTNDESAGMRQQIADYYTCVNRADEGLGVLMDLVRERGLSTNTLVVLLGDNGPPFPHAKVSSFEAGVNTPLAITWPGRVKAQVSDALVCGIDFLPTFCEVAGVKPPAGLPGRSRLPLLRGEPVPWREWLKAVGYYTAALNKTPHMKPDACFPWDDALDGSGKNPPLMREQFATTLKHAAAANKPFFINVNIQDPHRPFPGSSAVDAEEGNSTQPQAETAKGKGKKARRLEKNKTKYDQMRTYRPEEIKVPEFLEDIPPVRTEVAQYYTGVARLDISLRGVLDVLKANGHEDDTIVLFLSDHGMSFPFSKATVYFNGTRSPVIVKYPGMPAAARHEEFVSSVDILPTLLERRWRRPAKPTSASPPA